MYGRAELCVRSRARRQYVIGAMGMLLYIAGTGDDVVWSTVSFGSLLGLRLVTVRI